MFTSQLVVNGNCKQVEIVKAFGISVISAKRHVKKYRSRGPAAFYERPKQRKPRVLTPEVIIQAQGLLNEGHSTSEAAKTMGIKPDTLVKAIQSGRLLETKKKLKKAAQKATAAQHRRQSGLNGDGSNPDIGTGISFHGENTGSGQQI